MNTTYSNCECDTQYYFGFLDTSRVLYHTMHIVLFLYWGVVLFPLVCRSCILSIIEYNSDTVHYALLETYAFRSYEHHQTVLMF